MGIARVLLHCFSFTLGYNECTLELNDINRCGLETIRLDSRMTKLTVVDVLNLIKELSSTMLSVSCV